MLVYDCHFAVALSMIMYPFSSSLNPKQSQLSRSQTTKLARSYHLDAVASISLSSTLEQLYTWEKKLYKQVKVISNNISLRPSILYIGEEILPFFL